MTSTELRQSSNQLTLGCGCPVALRGHKPPVTSDGFAAVCNDLRPALRTEVIVLNDGAKGRTLAPDVLLALRELESPWDRLRSAQATKPKRLGAIRWPD
jgi:hypothetical protein